MKTSVPVFHVLLVFYLFIFYNLGADHLTLEGGGWVILKTKFPASAWRKKKITCNTNVIENKWEKMEKDILPTRLLGNQPPSLKS